MNHWIATNMAGSYCLETCSRSHHIYALICSKCLPPAQTQARNRMFSEQRDSDCSFVLDVSSQFIDIWDLGTRWKQTFLACRVKMMWLRWRLNLSPQLSQDSAGTYRVGQKMHCFSELITFPLVSGRKACSVWKVSQFCLEINYKTCMSVSWNILCLIRINRETPEITLYLTRTLGFCSIFTHNRWIDTFKCFFQDMPTYFY